MSKIAIISTGGTVAAIGADAFDVVNYDAGGRMLDVDELLELLPPLGAGELIRVPFGRHASAAMGFDVWRDLARQCRRLAQDDPKLDGIVVLHGTASMEETAYFLHLTCKTEVPIVLTGSQRPPTALSSDAAMNIRNAIRVAACTEARGLGVLVVMNDEIHAAREVTKASTLRLQAFQSADFGLLGHCDGDGIRFYRKPVRRSGLDSEFDVHESTAWPRVDIAYSYAGADGTAVRAFVNAGALGIVSAGFAPGCTPPGEESALRDAVTHGAVVVQCSRAGSGRVPESELLVQAKFLSGDNLNPQKARVLLAIALAAGADVDGVRRIFATY